LPTDRLYAEWWLRSDRVESLLGAETKSAPGSGSEVVQRVSIPASIYAWKSDVDRRHLALDLQTRTREALEAGFREGLTVIGYERDPEGNGSYLLGRWSVP
jgi:predicted GNAT superfamily acetyltransferase